MFRIHSISKLVLAAMIHHFKGDLKCKFTIGNLPFDVDEILHHSSGIIDKVDLKMYSIFDHINKPHGMYSNYAFNYLGTHIKDVIGITYNKALNEFNKFLDTNFVSTKLKDDIGTWDLSTTEEDLHKLGSYVQRHYNWFANGESRRAYINKWQILETSEGIQRKEILSRTY